MSTCNRFNIFLRKTPIANRLKKTFAQGVQESSNWCSTFARTSLNTSVHQLHRCSLVHLSLFAHQPTHKNWLRKNWIHGFHLPLLQHIIEPKSWSWHLHTLGEHSETTNTRHWHHLFLLVSQLWIRKVQCRMVVVVRRKMSRIINSLTDVSTTMSEIEQLMYKIIPLTTPIDRHTTAAEIALPWLYRALVHSCCTSEVVARFQQWPNIIFAPGYPLDLPFKP